MKVLLQNQYSIYLILVVLLKEERNISKNIKVHFISINLNYFLTTISKSKTKNYLNLVDVKNKKNS
jgi:hypothetical protein